MAIQPRPEAVDDALAQARRRGKELILAGSGVSTSDAMRELDEVFVSLDRLYGSYMPIFNEEHELGWVNPDEQHVYWVGKMLPYAEVRVESLEGAT